MKFESFITITLPTFITNCLMTFMPCHAQEAASLHDEHNDQIINITAIDYAFEAPDEIPSGWTTIEYTNKGQEPHMLLFHRLPEDKAFEDFVGKVYPSVNDWWLAIRDEGMSQSDARETIELPKWYNAAQQWMGGAGIIAPGLTSEITLNLKPGTYAMECYIKTEDGELHAMEGMIRELTVTDHKSHTKPPEANIKITLTNNLMAIDGDLAPGKHTIAVHLAEGFMHNVHVARLGPDTNIHKVVDWMYFLNIGGMWPPAPATFLGGMHILQQGETGYFTVDLDQGRYLFVSEMTGSRGVLKEITVK